MRVEKDRRLESPSGSKLLENDSEIVLKIHKWIPGSNAKDFYRIICVFRPMGDRVLVQGPPSFNIPRLEHFDPGHGLHRIGDFLKRFLVIIV